MKRVFQEDKAIMNKRIVTIFTSALMGFSMTACGQSAVETSESETVPQTETIFIEESDTSASQNDELLSDLVGVWSYYDAMSDEYSQFNFDEDGTVTIRQDDYEAEAAYELDGDEMTLIYVSGEAFEDQTLGFEIDADGETLTLTTDDGVDLVLGKGAFEVKKSSTAQTGNTNTAAESETEAIESIQYDPISGDTVNVLNGTMKLDVVSLMTMPSADGASLESLSIRFLMENTSSVTVSVLLIQQNFNGISSDDLVYSGYEGVAPGTLYKSTITPGFDGMTTQAAFPVSGASTYTMTVIVLQDGADFDTAAKEYASSGAVADAISVDTAVINFSNFAVQ